METSARDSVLASLSGHKRPLDVVIKQERLDPSTDPDNNSNTRKPRIKKEPEEDFYRCAMCSRRVKDPTLTFDGPIKDRRRKTLVACSESCRASYKKNQCYNCKHHHAFQGKWFYHANQPDFAWYCSADCFVDAADKRRKRADKRRKVTDQLESLTIKRETTRADEITALDF